MGTKGVLGSLGSLMRVRFARIVLLTLSVLGSAVMIAGCTPSQGDRSVDVYCERVQDAVTLLDEGGSIASYNALLSTVVAASPPEHSEAWELLLTVSTEVFSYNNFNQAADAIERLDPPLDDVCTDLPRWWGIDGDGRLTAVGG